MKRRVLWTIAGLLLMGIGGGVLWLKSNQDWIAATIGRAVESATGRPLVLESPPSFSLFPHVGLDIGKASWGDPAKDELAVQLNGARIKVALAPLFSKKIEVGEVILDSPRILVRPGSGTRPEAAAADRPGKTENGGQPGQAVSAKRNTPQSMALSLDSVRIKDGEVILELPDRTLRLSRLDLDLSDLAPERTGALRLTAAMTLTQDGRRMESPIALRTAFTPRLPLIELRDLGLTLGPIPGIVEAPLTISGNLDAYTVNPRVEHVDINAAIAGSTLRLAGQAQFEDLIGHFAFNLDCAVRQTLSACRVAYQPADAHALGALKLAGNLKVRGQTFELDELTGNLDETAIKAEMSASLPDAFEARVDLDRLNLDRYLPVQTDKPAPAKAGTAAASSAPAGIQPPAGPENATPARYPQIKADLSIGSLTVGGLTLQTLKAKVQGKQGTYTVSPCTFTLYEAKVASTLKAVLPTEQFRLQTSLDKLNAGALLRDLAKVDKVQSRLNLRADLAVRGTTEAAVRRSLTGTAQVTGQADIDTEMLPKEWGGLFRDIRTLSLNKVDVRAQAKNGQISLKPITAAGKLLAISGSGQVQLPANTLDLHLDASVSKVHMPLFVRGSLDKPDYGIDAAEAIQNILQDPKVMDKSGKALEKGAKSLEKEAKKLLRKLR